MLEVRILTDALVKFVRFDLVVVSDELPTINAMKRMSSVLVAALGSKSRMANEHVRPPYDDLLV